MRERRKKKTKANSYIDVDVDGKLVSLSLYLSIYLSNLAPVTPPAPAWRGRPEGLPFKRGEKAVRVL